MNVKYQIFVSSTYEDLRDERNEVIKACLNMGHIPVGMEMFNAADEEQWAVITRTIDQCDYYVVIVAHRYGSTVDGISFTEKEYDYAVSQAVPVLGFVIDENASWPSNRIDKDQVDVEALKLFKSKVKGRMIRSWRDRTELQAHFAISLGTTINVNPRRGWVRAAEAGGADITQTLSDLADENSRLRKILEQYHSSASYPDEINDVVKVIDSYSFSSDDKMLAGADLALAIIEYLQDSPYSVYLADIGHRFGDFDAEEIKSFVKRLIHLGIIRKGESDWITPSDKSQLVYARISANKQKPSPVVW
ncbi:MAG: hypothetical protein K0R41_2087 [Geminicoccaceae bacterium]|jgi:hypothetical protein|nr:hypothetical protein [Geminicoccaceae bacterium]